MYKTAIVEYFGQILQGLNIYSYSEDNPDIIVLSAAYGFGLTMNHCFTDGNKRVALSAVDAFLQLNGFELVASEVDAVSTTQEVAAGKMSAEELIEWIRQNHQEFAGD